MEDMEDYCNTVSLPVLWHKLTTSVFVYSVCLLGNRSLKNEYFETCAKVEVVKNITVSTNLSSLFCVGQHANCTYDEYFTLNNLTEIRAIPGLLSGVIKGE